MALQWSDNSGDELRIPADPTLARLDQHTCIMWVNVTATGASFSRILSYTDNSGAVSDGLTLFNWSGDDNWYWRMRTSSGSPPRVDYAVSDFLDGFGWTFLAWTFDFNRGSGDKFRVYYAYPPAKALTVASFAATSEGGGNILAPADDDDMTLGAFPTGAGSAGMDASQFIWWNRALSLREIYDQFHHGLSATPGCLACYDLHRDGQQFALVDVPNTAKTGPRFNATPSGLANVAQSIYIPPIRMPQSDLILKAIVAPAGGLQWLINGGLGRPILVDGGLAA